MASRTSPFGSVDRASDQDEPFQVNTLPLSSTAAQKEAEGQETETRTAFGSMDVGADQDEPFQVNTLPLFSTATQKEAEAQDTK